MNQRQLLFEKSRPGKTGARFSSENPVNASFSAIDKQLRRQDIPNFPELSEVEIVRHYTNLSQLNYCVDQGFYPLGSCTMKYNPKVNDRVAGLRGLSAHPYAPHDLVQGNLEIMSTLQQWLIALTGLPGFTLVPAAGAHGEYTGMMVVRKYLSSTGNPRKVVLIPDSAHGTNPASASFAGYEIRQIPSDENGIISPAILREHLDDSVAALMMTNPNTLGIFEKNIREIADLLHRNGSLLYMDGANMNAFMGVFRPGDLGVDVLHLNLHKTFSTPHGGGGPGSGPVGVSAKLIPFLPVPALRTDGDTVKVDYFNKGGVGRVKNFYGNFLVMVRALAYLMALGKENIRRVAEDAVLNANYIRKKLEPHLLLPYPAKTLHEVIFSDENLSVKTLDIAKRLLDYGYHPFTIYFPLIVHGAMMIEPTETESKETLDGFLDAMIAILQEAKTDPEAMHRAPEKTPVSRLDEVSAARKPILKWQMEE